MARSLLYECFAGISGDMHLGALIDVGVPVDVLRRELGRLELAGEFELVAGPAAKMGISGTRAHVQLAPDAERPARGLRAILGLIERAAYPPAVRARAVAMFQALAEAEAKIHGLAVEAVHFHEVGATDSIADIVGAAIGWHHLACGPPIAARWNSAKARCAAPTACFRCRPPPPPSCCGACPARAASKGKRPRPPAPPS